MTISPELEKRDKNKLKDLDYSLSSDLKSSLDSLSNIQKEVSNNFTASKISNLDEIPNYKEQPKQTYTVGKVWVLYLNDRP